MKHIYIFLCLFLLSAVLSNNSNASGPTYCRECARIIKYSYTDFVLWNNELPDTKHWTTHCWSLVYYEDGKWHFDVKTYGEIVLRQDEERIRIELRIELANEKKRLYEQEPRKENYAISPSMILHYGIQGSLKTKIG